MKRPTQAERRRRRAEQASATDLIGHALTAYGIARELREHRLVLEWEQIVGRRVALRTQPDGLRDGVLWVRVSNSAWLQELSFLKRTIVDRANELVGDPPLVRELRFHIGNRRPNDDDDVVAALNRQLAMQRRPRRKRNTPASGEQLAAIERETEGVADDALRAAIREARTKLNM